MKTISSYLSLTLVVSCLFMFSCYTIRAEAITSGIDKQIDINVVKKVVNFVEGVSYNKTSVSINQETADGVNTADGSGNKKTVVDLGVVFSIVLYMLGMLLVGYYSYKRTVNLEDYMLGGRSLGAAVTALSAGAADMSGWLMMGLPGAMFLSGMSSAWIVVGLVIGAYLNWTLVARRLRVYSEVLNNSITVPAYLENRFKDTSRLLRIISGLVILVFFTFYVSSGFVAGATMFQATFGMSYNMGMLILGVVVVSYTLFGGFLAVSFTDFIQGIIMVVALITVPVVVLTHVGGVSQAYNDVYTIDPKLLDMFNGTTWVAIVSLLAWGLGYFGQPHIVVRFMAISSAKEIKKARMIGMSWMIFSIFGAMLTGLLGISYYYQNSLTLANPETVFIQLGTILFTPIITGILLSAILAAIMSTISSQLIVTSSALTEDIYHSFISNKATNKRLILFGRMSVLIISIIAIILAVNPNNSILNLVGHAWAGFGSAFGPVILISLLWKRMTKTGAIAGIVAGAVVVIVWPMIDAVKELYEMIPGFMFSTITIFIVSMLDKNNAEIEEEFENVEHSLKSFE